MTSAGSISSPFGARLSVALTAALVTIGVGVLIANAGSSGQAVSVPTATSTVPPEEPVVATTAVATTTSAPFAPTPTTEVTTTVTTATTTSTTPTTTTVAPTTAPPPSTLVVNGVPTWEPYEPVPPLVGVAALTGEPVDQSIADRPIVAVKIDNHSRARGQWGLDQADVIIEENVEGVTRFVALFHTRLPDRVGPVRSARTGDLDLLAAMNRPVLGWSGGNRGVTNWVRSAASSGVLVDFSAQTRPCYNRSSSRSSPHNLQLNPQCAIDNAPAAGPARQLWPIEGDWVARPELAPTPDTTFEVQMDGVRVGWTWDAASGTYLRSQNGSPHVSFAGERITAHNVVEITSFHARSPVDGRSPNPITIGGTHAVVHRDGVAIVGTWHRETAYDVFGFYAATTGELIPLDTGTTFVELVRE